MRPCARSNIACRAQAIEGGDKARQRSHNRGRLYPHFRTAEYLSYHLIIVRSCCIHRRYFNPILRARAIVNYQRRKIASRRKTDVVIDHALSDVSRASGRYLDVFLFARKPPLLYGVSVSRCCLHTDLRRSDSSNERSCGDESASRERRDICATEGLKRFTFLVDTRRSGGSISFVVRFFSIKPKYDVCYRGTCEKTQPPSIVLSAGSTLGKYIVSARRVTRHSRIKFSPLSEISLRRE